MKDYKTIKEEFLTKVAFLLWEIWKARNAFVYEAATIDPSLIARKANLAAAEFITCKNHKVISNSMPVSHLHSRQSQSNHPNHGRTSISLSPTVSNVTEIWSPPPPGHFKINCDAAWIESSKLTGISALARDCHGTLFDGATLLCRAGSVLEAEAAAAVVAIEVAKRLPPSPIILESDSKALVDQINNSKFPCNWKIAPVVTMIQNSITSNPRLAWFWISRKANSAADLVASLVVRKKCPEVWIDRPPSSLVFVLSRDGLPCPPPSILDIGSP
ncbi:PREDICTED: uncharacterized protein LOC101315365 [Fragaria vesca subsp. vesca]|uniref:uncharacterized protein LOC101315365 n=1 Tax=Fragaria vesca subsp. vesca TaxID=101020 RepID=UPI0002C31A61|nr:PREDICTED: uncharacterized protein LOC101315365 [Fragaria vesca subsp. vesca]